MLYVPDKRRQQRVGSLPFPPPPLWRSDLILGGLQSCRLMRVQSGSVLGLLGGAAQSFLDLSAMGTFGGLASAL